MPLKKFGLLCLLAIGLFCQVSAQHEDINFTSLTTKDGLSSNTVNAIVKDRYGLIWFGTEDGLNKFDGTNFTVYRHQRGNTNSLQANEILSLHEDQKGNLWIGTSGGSLSLYDRKKDAFINFPASGTPNSIGNNVIRGITSDHLGRIWIANFGGVNLLDPGTKKISNVQVLDQKSASLFRKICICIYADSRQKIWIGTEEGLFRYDPETKSIKQYAHKDDDPSSIIGNYVNTIAEDKQGNLWIGTNKGLSLLKPGNHKFINYKQVDDDVSISSSINFIYSVAVDGDQVWMGTTHGLSILDSRSGIYRNYNQDNRNIHSLTAKWVRSIYIDNEGIHWLGTGRGGVDKYDKNLNLFTFVQSNAFDEKGLNAPIVTSFAEGKNGKIYVGTDGGGLTLFDRNTRLFQKIPLQSGLKRAASAQSILALKMTQRNELLIGTYEDGLFILNTVNGSYRQLLLGEGTGDLNNNNIYFITEDRKGNKWIGTNGAGIIVLNSENKIVARYTPNPKFENDILLPTNGYIRDILEDKKGNIWIATHGGGLAIFTPATGKFTVYTTYNSNLPHDKVQTLLEDRQGSIWGGTFGGGLFRFDKTTKQFQIFSEKEGVQNNVIQKILEDPNGSIWVSSNRGISSIDIATQKINNYNYHNGIQNNNMVRGAGLRLSNGDLFFGGLEGFNYFNPANLKKNNSVPPVLITDLRISNQSVAPSEGGPIKENISIAKEINLEYKQNFELRFVGLNYTSPEKNQYAYKLEGLDKDWNYVGNSTTASYTNLDPGAYTFRVKASNNDGVWNNVGASIKIVVHPPFWRTVYAYVFYAFAIISILLYIRYRGIKKFKRRFALEQERKEAERIRELDRLKIKFLTNLSHEFRTPISLILGPVDNILLQEKNERLFGQLSMVKRNARRLLNLVNQLLDFRKMEEQELKLHPTEGELVSFIKEVSDSFTDLSVRKKITFLVSSDIEKLYTFFDHDKMERILFNLLSNAFKFTLEGGQIRLQLEKQDSASDPSRTWVSIKVSDTGIGIPEDKKEKIFERFFQHTTATAILNQGTGIGLSITKEFVRMFGGTIKVESQPGIGSTFILHLPFVPLKEPAITSIVSPEPTEPDIVTEPQDENAQETDEAVFTSSKTELPSILLVEDNDDFRFYLKDNLRLHYKIFEAANGKEGWQKALANHPQLIVSDINMPFMDGIALTKKIKADNRTNHIPVILLTALTGEEDQLKGLGTGANDYITKPFNVEVLIAKIKNQLVLNTTLKHTYTKQIKVLTTEIEVESANEKLVRDIVLYIEENLTDPQLSVENLSRHVGMSRSTLYIKMMELTGQTPVEFIRSIKLEKAAVLFEKSDMNVSQIAYATGFSSPTYFTKAFKVKFNMSPTEYINKMRKESERKNTHD